MNVTKVLYMLYVSDMDRAVGFYGDVIGLHVGFQSPGWSELRFGDSTVALHLGSDRRYRMTGLNFEVSDIETACSEVDSAGGSVALGPYKGGPPGLTLADVEDADGNRFQLSHHAA